jgi:hypothetical protein
MVNSLSYVIFYAYSLYLFSCMVYCLFPNLNGWMDVCMHACNRIENDPVEEPEELTGEAPEQQSVGGGKCPLTYLCPIHSLIHLPHYTFILKD